MSNSPSWNSEEKRIDTRLRRGTSQDRQQHRMNNGGGGLPPGRNYRQGGYQNRDGGGYHNKDGGHNRGYDVRRQQQNQHQHQRPPPRMSEHELAYQLAHHNPGVHFEAMRQPPPPTDGGSMMGGPHRAWVSGPPPLYLNCQQSPVPIPQQQQPPPQQQQQAPQQQQPRQQQQHRSTNNTIRNNKKDGPISRKSPEVGSKLLEDDDSVSYVAAGTAPVGSFRSGPSPIPKNASPVPMPLVTNFAGQVLTRAAYQHEDQQFDRHNAHGGGEQKPHYGGGQNQDGRHSRNGREKRDSTGPSRHSPGPYFPNQHPNDQVLNQLAQISVLQHIQNRVLGGQDVQSTLQRLMENKGLIEQLQQHCQQQQQGQKRDLRSPDQRTYPVGRPMPRAPGDECGVFGQRLSRNGDMASISSEEIVPALMKFIQQQSSTCSPDQQDEGKVLPMLNSSAWPAVGPRIDTDSSGHVSPSPPLVSPTKQNYSSVVARCSSRSSTSESVKDGPILYSTKAASNLSPVPQHEGARFDAIKPLCPPPGQQQQYKDQRGGSPVLPVSIAAAAAAAASNKTRNDNSLTFAKTHPPCPPPTTPVDIQGQFEVSKMDVLSEQIWHYHNSITQTEAMLTRKLHLRDMLYYAISPIFPMCGLYVVGSSLNGFGNNSSDMDLCLMITNKDLDQKTDAVVVLNMILTTLSKLDWVSNQHLILAKVPILRIKFTSPWQDITVDLNANNSVAIKNTHLLCYYSSFDWRVRPLVSVVKEWAKKKGINDANRSSFTSYSLVLMVIHYLQCGADPAILPSLQVMYPKRFHARVDVRTLNVTQPLQHPSEEWQYQEKTSLGELFIGFLNYYANKFDYDRDAISVRQGRRVDRASLAIKRPHGTTGGPPNNSWRSQWRCICIEEPFTQSNTAHSIYDEMVFGAIKSAFRDAHEELEKNRDLHSLLDCRPISVSLPHNGAVVYAFDNSAAASSTASPSPTAEVIGSSSINSINTAMTRSSSSANSVDGEEAEKVHSQSFDHSRRKSSSKRGGGSSNSHQQGRKPSSSAVPSVAVSPVVSC